MKTKEQKKLIPTLLIFIFAFTFIFSCSSASTKRTIGSSTRNSDDLDSFVKRKESKSKRGRNQKFKTKSKDKSPENEKTTRLMIYEASLVNSVRELDTAISKTKSLVKNYKAYIEKQVIQKRPALATFRIRVPVIHFDHLVNELSKIGRVTARNIKAQDITRQFSDLSQKLENRRRLLKRLYKILQKTKKTKQKIRIINEIARLQKQIDLMQARKKYLARKASFSTIDIQFHAQKKLVINIGSAIPWIRNLQPDKRTLWQNAGFEIPLPSGFIDNSESFKNKGNSHFISPDGVHVRVASLKNNPKGDIAFYKKALLFEQKRFPNRIVSQSIKGDRFLLTIPRQIGYKKSYYTLMFVVDADELHIVEILYPNKTIFEKRKQAIQNSLDKFELKSIFEKIIEVIW